MDLEIFTGRMFSYVASAMVQNWRTFSFCALLSLFCRFRKDGLSSFLLTKSREVKMFQF